jgi:hypothetical protein
MASKAESVFPWVIYDGPEHLKSVQPIVDILAAQVHEVFTVGVEVPG